MDVKMELIRNFSNLSKGDAELAGGKGASGVSRERYALSVQELLLKP